MNRNRTKKAAAMSLSAMMLLSPAVSAVHAVDDADVNNEETIAEQTEVTNDDVKEEAQTIVEQDAEEETKEEAPAATETQETEEETKVDVQETQTYKEGVTVVADNNSKSGYMAHFVYNLTADRATKGTKRSALLEAIPENAEITGVKLVGSFRLFSEGSKPTDYTDHGLEAYEPGDFTSNVNPFFMGSPNPPAGQAMGEWSYEMKLNENTGNYEVDLPMISGAHYYYYQISYTADGRTRTVGVDDPKNVSPCRVNEDKSDSDTGDITHSIVYGKYSSKQGNTPNLDYMTPYEGSKKGSVQYVEYKGTRSEHQDLGIYLPAGYDANRTKPYRVIYLSHGAGGNETYWLTQPQGQNVMDHMIAENPDQEAIVVCLDNTLYNWDYYQIGENVTKYVIPYMEANYNVSKEAKDRAFAGFSMGSMTTTYMAFHHADKFGYFGIFSGCNIGNATFKDGFTYDSSKLRGEGGDAYLQEVYKNIEPSQDLLNSVVYTQAGTYDTAVHANGFGLYGAYETIRDWAKDNMPAGNFVDGGLVPGSHDIYTWAQCLYNFSKDVCWSKEKTDTPDTDKPSTGDTEKPSTGDTEKPSTGTTEKPSTDTKPAAPVSKKDTSTVKTGDDTQLWGLATTMVLAGGTICMIKRKKKHA